MQELMISSQSLSALRSSLSPHSCGSSAGADLSGNPGQNLHRPSCRRLPSPDCFHRGQAYSLDAQRTGSASLFCATSKSGDLSSRASSGSLGAGLWQSGRPSQSIHKEFAKENRSLIPTAPNISSLNPEVVLCAIQLPSRAFIKSSRILYSLFSASPRVSLGHPAYAFLLSMKRSGLQCLTYFILLSVVWSCGVVGLSQKRATRCKEKSCGLPNYWFCLGRTVCLSALCTPEARAFLRRTS